MSLLTGGASDFLKIGVAAAGRGDMDTVRAVFAERPDWVARTGSHGRTMLCEAAYRGRAEMVDYLLDRGADIDACGCHFTPLLVDISPYCAARYRPADIRRDASPRAKRTRGLGSTRWFGATASGNPGPDRPRARGSE